MTGCPESASVDRDERRVLVCGVNWVGDTIMSLPALQAYRVEHPKHHLTMLVRPAIRALMDCHDVPDELLVYSPEVGGTRAAVRALAERGFDEAIVLPNSFRSAWIPFLARVPHRRGRAGHARSLLLTDVLPPAVSHAAHQALEYYQLLVPSLTPPLAPEPRLNLPDEAVEKARAAAGLYSHPWITLIPGAARGPSKAWPASHFAEVGKRWLATSGEATVLVLGTSEERGLCDELAAQMNGRGYSLAGQTDVATWMALLSLSDLVVANDSGGAHVAAALGRPTVAIFGMTHPAITAPLGPRVSVVCDEGRHTRDIPRDSKEATKRLASIQPERVYEATLQLMEPPTLESPTN